MMKINELENKVVEILKTIYDPEIPVDVFELGLAADPNVTSAKVNIVFDPPWDKDMMSEEAMLELGFL